MSYRGIYELRFTRAQGWNVEESCPGHGRRGSPARRFRLSERKSCGDLSRRKAKVWSACVLVYLAVYERPTGLQRSLSAHRRQAQPTEGIVPGYSLLRRLAHGRSRRRRRGAIGGDLRSCKRTGRSRLRLRQRPLARCVPRGTRAWFWQGWFSWDEWTNGFRPRD